MEEEVPEVDGFEFPEDATRRVEAVGAPAEELWAVVLERVFDVPPDEVWDACTDAERIVRWFLPVSGELRAGGRYQLEGNAGGTIERCDRPSGFSATWEFGEAISRIDVRLDARPAGGTGLELRHTVGLDEHWRQFGPGATGVGWDLALIGLDLHLRNGEAVDTAAVAEWMAIAGGRRLIAASSDAWRDANVAAGAGWGDARKQAAATTAAYTGTESLTPAEAAACEGLEDWRVLLHTLQGSFRTGSMSRGLDLAARIAAAADAVDHHPDIAITYPRVRVVLTSHDAGGLTSRDVDLARTISSIAAELGIAAEPGAVAELEIAIDALDIDAVKPFWEAVLGYRSEGTDECADPHRHSPAFWFQQMDAPRQQRNRIHIDVTVPHDVAADRIAAALAAGGTLVSDAAAPAFWILADPEGNEACVCTWQGRD